MSMHKNKRFADRLKAKVLLAILIIGTASASISGMVHATYTSDNSNSPAQLLFTQLFYDATLWCAQNSSISYPEEVSLSAQTDWNGDDRAVLLSYLQLNGNQFTSNKKLYSDILEKQYQTNGGRHNGSVYCSQLNGILKNVTTEAGATAKGAFCAIYDINAGYKGRYVESGNVPEGWPENGNCEAQYDALYEALSNGVEVPYQGSGARNEGFYVNIKPKSASERSANLEALLSSGLGDFGEGNEYTRTNKLYQLYYYTVSYGCGTDLNSSYDKTYTIDNPPPEYANNYILLPDQSGAWHYYDTDNFSNNDKVYPSTGGEIGGKTAGVSCRQAVENLASLVEDNPNIWKIATQYPAMESCLTRYLAALDDLVAQNESLGSQANVFRSRVTGKTSDQLENVVWSADDNGVVSCITPVIESSDNDGDGGGDRIGTISTDADVDTADGSAPEGAGSSNSGADLNACQKSGGVFSLGWWICPIINTLTNAAQDIYNKLLEPRLFIEPQLFTSNGGQNVTYNVWNDFRNFANIIFVIMILVIVFSQLTGVGIDNYGIKRTLPKLIVAAVLVNLSYIICQLCVDLSNIVGKGIFDTFVNLTKDIHFTISVGDDGNLTGAIIGTALIGAIAGFGIWSSLGIVGLFSVLVSSIVSLFFLFILLAAREAAIVVLTILSPLAFVCYMLPNTKQLFSKWMKLGEGLLLVYPISALLVAGGSYVAKLILNINVTTDNEAGFFTTLTAIVISIIPIFFIPTVLKNSFSALGNIGAKISGFGQRMGGGAAKAMRNTRLMRNLEKNQQSRREFRDVESAARRAQRTMTKYGKRDRKTLSARQQQKLLEAEQTMGQYRAQRAKAAVGEAVVTEDYAKAEAEDQYNMKQGQINAGKVATTIEVAQAQAENENINRAATNTVGVAKVTKDYAEAQAENEFNVRQAEYKHPAPIVAPNVAEERVIADRQSKELKNYSDQYATWDNGAIEKELTAAAQAYKSDDEASATRLQAALAAAEGRKMYKEMLGNSDLKQINFQNGKGNDTRILSQMANSGNQVFSQYGKQRAKNSGTAMNLDNFAKSTSSTDGLAAALKSKGGSVAVGMDDDTLAFIAGLSNPDVLSTEMLVNAATNTDNEKELTQINNMLRARSQAAAQNQRPKETYRLNQQQITKLQGKTISAMDPTIWRDTVRQLQQTKNTDSTRRIAGSMKDQNLRQRLGL